MITKHFQFKFLVELRRNEACALHTPEVMPNTGLIPRIRKCSASGRGPSLCFIVELRETEACALHTLEVMPKPGISPRVRKCSASNRLPPLCVQKKPAPERTDLDLLFKR